jgi:hypothetical protein
MWSGCNLVDGRWIETRSCVDVNSCNDEIRKPKEVQDCEPPQLYNIEVGETVSQCGLDVKINFVTISKYISYNNSDGNMVTLTLTENEYLVVPNVEIINNFRHRVRASFRDFMLEDQNGVIHHPRCPNETENDFEACQNGDIWHLGQKYIENSEKREANFIFFVPDSVTEVRLLYSMPPNLLNSYDCNIANTIVWKLN